MKWIIVGIAVVFAYFTVIKPLSMALFGYWVRSIGYDVGEMRFWTKKSAERYPQVWSIDPYARAMDTEPYYRVGMIARWRDSRR